VVARVSKKTKRWFIRLGISIAASPIIIFVFGILSPTPAHAEEATSQTQEPPASPTSDTSTSTSPSDSTTVVTVDSTQTSTGGDTNSTQSANTTTNASEEVIQPAAPVGSPQDPLAVAAAAVATAVSTIETVSQVLQEAVTQAATLIPVQAVTNAVESATQAVAQATEAISNAVTAIATAETKVQEATDATAASETADAAVVVAQGELDVAEDSLQVAEEAVDAQEVVVADAVTTKDAAQEVVNTNTAPGLNVEVYNVQGQNNAPFIPNGATPIRTYTDTNGIAEYWGGGNVAGSNHAEDVIVVYRGQITFTSTGTTWFTAQADDGTLVYFNNQLVANDWYDKGGGGSTIAYQTTAGQTVPFALSYYENGGAAFVEFLRFTQSGWVVETNFTTSSATPAQLAALSQANTVVVQETAELETLQVVEAEAQDVVDEAEVVLTSAQATAVTAQATEEVKIAESTEAVETAVVASNVATQAIASAEAAVSSASQVVAVETMTQAVIGSPSGLVVTPLENGSVVLTWSAPEGSDVPVERYAITWQANGSGWGVATGNAGDANALNTTITLDAQLFESTGGWDTTYTFSVRADNDSLGRYSEISNVVAVDLTDPTPPPPVEPPTPPVEPPTPPTEPEEPPVEPPVEPEEPPVEPEEPPVEPEEPPVEPEEPPVEPEEPEPTQEEVVDTAIEDALGDGKITAADAEQILDALDADGVVTNEEVSNLVDALSENGNLSTAEESLIIDAISADGEISNSEVANLVDSLTEDGKLTAAEKEFVADVLIAQADGEAVTAENIEAAGLDFEDLPAETPVEVRTDADGNPVVITAEVADALEILENPAELLGEVFSDPGKVLTAFSNIGADMSEEEREESQEVVVAAVIVGNIAAVAAAAVAGGGAPAGGSSGGGSGGGGPVGGSSGGRGRNIAGRRKP
jgi:hypothetical protein